MPPWHSELGSVMTKSQDVESIPFALTDTDRENLAGGDENFQPHTWSELKQIIAANDLSILKRKPSDLLRYIAWTNQTKATYGSITDFVLQQRLFWRPLPSSTSESGPRFDSLSAIPFAAREDFKILLNDWPYGVSPGLTHLIVWSKVRIPDQKPEGYLTPESTALVRQFVRETFVDRLAANGTESAEDRVLWFRNWTRIQSVRGLEHVHVLLRDAPKDLLQAWINENKA